MSRNLLLRLPAVGDNAGMQFDPSKAAPPKRKRRWFQFSLRSLLIVTMIVAVGSGWLGRKIERKRIEREAVAGIEASGGSVWYDYQQGQFSEPSGPVWLRGLLGNDFFSEVVKAHLVGNTIGDAGLANVMGLPRLQSLELPGAYVNEAGVAHIKNLAQLESLDLSTTNVTDAELANIKDLPRLRSLDLSSTNVTDAGLANLKILSQLRVLKLKYTKVTDAGLKSLQQALPNCRIDR
jgi:Leucine rich repeat